MVVKVQVLFVDFVPRIVSLLRVTKNGAVVFVEKTLANNGVNGILDVIVTGEIVELVIVVSKAEDCVDFGNDTELLEVDLCAYVGGVGVLVCVFPPMIWTGVLLDFGVMLLVNEVRDVVDLVLKMRKTDVVAGIIVLVNVGLIEAGLNGVGGCTEVNGTCVPVLPVNIVV